MENGHNNKTNKTELSHPVPNFSKPVWGEAAMSCDSCKFNDQDIDTFPCAKCHTRH